MSKATNKLKAAKQAASEVTASDVAQKLDNELRARARRRKAREAIMPSPEEDAVITAAALDDPDNQPLTEEQLGQFKPARRGRGRPTMAVTKVPVSLRLDRVLVESFKAMGEGWQTRMNEALLGYAVEHKILLRRYHATVQKPGNETQKVFECMVLASDDGAAKAKVKNYLRTEGREADAAGRVVTEDIGFCMVEGLPVVH